MGAIEDARAFAIATSAGETASIESEQAVILWDEAGKTEHLIRKVDFSAHGKGLGFLVPTPTRPEIVESFGDAFERLEALLPRTPAAAQAAPDTVAADIDEAVTVHEEKRAAGMDVAILEANNAAAISGWLKRHGYSSRPALEKWLEPYVRQGFKISAFKYAKPTAGDWEIPARTVRISFETKNPFYPYRIPTDTDVSSSQPLRIYLLASKKTRGYLTEASKKRDWGQIIHAQPLMEVSEVLAGVLPKKKIPAGELWLTVFNDQNATRTGKAELYFEKAP